MRPIYSQLSAPSSGIISYDEAADHLRVDSDADKAYIEALIGVAAEYVAMITGRALSQSAWMLQAEDWEDITTYSRGEPIARIYRAPLFSVSAIEYYPADGGELETMASGDYRANTVSDPGFIHFLADLPALASRPDAIQITFQAGYNSPSAAPATLRHAVKLMVAHLYEVRAPVNLGNIVNTIPLTLSAMIENNRIGGWFG
jgi:uncharacterized phiE125 gp8 family phage protein